MVRRRPGGRRPKEALATFEREDQLQMALMLARSEAVGNGSNGGPDPLIGLVKRRCGVVLTFNAHSTA
jgi:hypothetical protein